MKVTASSVIALATAFMSVSSGAALAAGQDRAASANKPAELEEVVVTAQRREESAQRAAVSLTAVSAQALLKKGVTDVTQLTQLAPALQVAPGAGPYDSFSVRGINNFAANGFADPAVVVSTAGVPLSHPTGAHGLFYDLERVEVLKGPQGTLYGRNATGGAVNVIPNHAQIGDLNGNLDIEIGNYNKRHAQGALNLPVNDKLALRGAFQVVDRDGFFKDGTGDEKAASGRLSARIVPNDDVIIDVGGDYSHDGGKGAGTAVYGTRDVIGGPAGSLHFLVDPWIGNLSSNPTIANMYAPAIKRNPNVPKQDNNYYGVSATISWVTPVGNLTIVPGYRGTDIHFIGNSAGFYVGEDAKTNQKSIEARLASGGDTKLRYVVGGFYLDDKLNSQYLTENSPTVMSNQEIHTGTETAAAFGQLTYSLSETFRLSGGLRYTHERKTTNSVRRDIGFGGTAPFDYANATFDPFPDLKSGFQRFTTVGDTKYNAVTWKAGVEWDVAPRSLLYANVSTGYKAGGFYFGPPGDNVYKPEKVTAYVIGSKNRFLENRLQVNAEAFYYRYRDQQIPHFRVLPPPFGNIFVTDNAGTATIKGVEIESQFAVTSDTLVHLDLQYLDGQYDKLTYPSPFSVSGNSTCASPANPAGGFTVDCSGRDLLLTPTLTLGGGIEHTFRLGNGGDLVASVDARHESSRETQLNYLPETKAPAYTKTDLNLTYHEPNRRWSLSAYVLNVTNKVIFAQTQVGRSYSIANGGPTFVWLQPPRTYGARLHLDF